jgi:hypothetical protein
VTSSADGRVVLWDGDSGAMLGSVTPAGTDIGVAAGFARRQDGEDRVERR